MSFAAANYARARRSNAKAQSRKGAKAKGKRPKAVGKPGEMALLDAVQKFVELNGGKLVVIGGVSVQVWPQDNAGVFHVAVKCMGRKPMDLLENKEGA